MKTTIIVKRKTRQELKQLGTKGQTYDQLINELIALKRNSKDSLDSGLTSLQSGESPSP